MHLRLTDARARRRAWPCRLLTGPAAGAARAGDPGEELRHRRSHRHRAERRESNTDVAIALTALSSEAIAAQRVNQVTDLAGLVPNLDIKEQVPGAIPVITIRGVGLNDFGAANNPSAGVYVDQVYVASIAMMSFDFYDLERIEVLKGPQGTLYGRNSTAGAINVITQQAARRVRGLHDAGLRRLRHDGGGEARSICRSATAPRCASARRAFSSRKVTGKAASCRARRSVSAT